jgi:predicted SnoaL-like aldol condensation-catalyzing enzyme
MKQLSSGTHAQVLIPSCGKHTPIVEQGRGMVIAFLFQIANGAPCSVGRVVEFCTGSLGGVVAAARHEYLLIAQQGRAVAHSDVYSPR